MIYNMQDLNSVPDQFMVPGISATVKLGTDGRGESQSPSLGFGIVGHRVIPGGGTRYPPPHVGEP